VVAGVNVQKNVANTFFVAPIYQLAACFRIGLFVSEGVVRGKTLFIFYRAFRFVPFALLAHRSLTACCRLLGCFACRSTMTLTLTSTPALPMMTNAARHAAVAPTTKTICRTAAAATTAAATNNKCESPAKS